MEGKDFKGMFRLALGNFLGLAFAVAFYFLLLRLSSIVKGFDKVIGILTPFVYGGVMAFILKTPCNFFEKVYEAYLPGNLKKKKSGLAVGTVFVLVMVALITLLSIVVPQVISSIVTLSRSVPVVTRRFFDWLSTYASGEGVLQSMVQNLIQNYIRPFVENFTNEAINWANTNLLPQLQSMVGDVTSTLTSIFGVLMNLVISVIVCIYTLGARKKFARQGKAVIYSIFKRETADKIQDEVHFINRTFDGFIIGKVLDSILVGIICYVFCMILMIVRGFPNAVLISVIIGVTNIIPYFGPFIGGVPALLIIAISDPVNALIFAIFIVLLQQVDGNYLGPRLLAGSVGLSGFWVLFSITLFSGLFGFAGVLMGVPVFAVIYDLLRKLIVKGLKKNGRTDLLIPGSDEPEPKSRKEKKPGFLEKVLNDRIAEKKNRRKKGNTNRR